jgi:PAS domain S-box-containing protein
MDAGAGNSDAHGVPSHPSTIVADEVATMESLPLLEALQASAPVAFGFVDLDFRVRRMNERMAEARGLAMDDIGGLLPELLAERWGELGPLYREVRDTGLPIHDHELVRACPDGAIHWLASFFPVRGDTGMVGIGIVALDISARKQAEAFQSVVMDNMAEGLYAIDAAGRITYANAAATRMLGWTEAELRGRPAHEVLHFQRADGTLVSHEECELLRVKASGETIRVDDDAFTCKDGTILPVAYSSAPLLSGDRIRGAVVVFRDTTEEQAERARVQRELAALTWVGRIQEALDDGRMVLHAQPIVPLRGGEPREELLLRMVGRDGSLIAPGSFLPVAERYGLITEIDRWVITQAVRLAATGRHVEANVSAESIQSLELLAHVEQLLEETGADPANLVFELTETALMRDIDAGEAFARRVVELGCAIALDDFGTGFASLTYLKRLPLRYIKIDVDFVRDLVDNTANRHLVEGIVHLARAFGYETIAEGVEDAEVLELLCAHGVDFAQGYHLGRPVPVDG